MSRVLSSLVVATFAIGFTACSAEVAPADPGLQTPKVAAEGAHPETVSFFGALPVNLALAGVTITTTNFWNCPSPSLYKAWVSYGEKVHVPKCTALLDIRVQYANTGSGMAGHHANAMYFNGSQFPFATVEHDSLAGGASLWAGPLETDRFYFYDAPSLPLGAERLMRVWLDGEFSVAETDETDNRFAFWIVRDP